jgi:twitching motility protein PilU
MERDQAIKFVHELLRVMLGKRASDLFITAGFPPAFKVDGKMTPVSNQSLTPTHTMELARAIMNDKQAQEFEASKECNFAISPPGIGRFRVNAFVQQARVGLVLRTITTTIPRFEDLGLPDVLKDVAMTKRGLVIFVGATGSGKSTSLAAMVGYRNENSHGHIITIEDPIEYVHEHKNCLITQREVGVDTDSWETALKNTLRQAPDVILIGEDSRSQHDGSRHRVRRNRPPLPGHVARQQLQPGAGPHHQLLPGRAPCSAADGFVAQLEGSGLAASDPAAGRSRPGAAIEIMLNTRSSPI